jgi:hypothetical protein
MPRQTTAIRVEQRLSGHAAAPLAQLLGVVVGSPLVSPSSDGQYVG